MPLIRTILFCLFVTTPVFFAHAQKVGFLLGTFVSDRWYLDQKLFAEHVAELGGEMALELAYDHDGQVTMARKLIADGIDVLVLVPLDGERAAEIAKLCKVAGIPLLAYDRAILSNDVAFYISYDNEKIGRLHGEYFVKRVPEGKYLLLNGPTTDNNVRLIRKGLMTVLQPYIDSGKIEIVADFAMKNWSEIGAFEFAQNYFAGENPVPDVLVAGNDALASGFIHAMPPSLTGHIRISGQDADVNALRNILAGKQTMTVYKPIKPLAYAAARIAMKFAQGNEVQGRTVFVADNIPVKALLLDPIVVDAENYNETVRKDGHAEMSEAVRNVGQVFETERSRIQLALMHKEKALETERQSNERNTFLGILMFFFATLVGLGYTIYQKQNDNKLLNDRKSLIETKNLELTEMNGQLQRLNEKLRLQKKEISAQRDAIALQNEKLAEVNTIIGLQKDEIQHQNERLEKEVQKRTAELIQHIRQLEQYSFVTAHNLRAPVARIIGLCQIAKMHETSPEEIQSVIEKLTTSSQELDLVFRELNAILNIQTFSMEIITPVNLEEEVGNVLSSLKYEIDQADAIIKTDLGEVPVIVSIKPYVKSILFNLISNAVKYRDPQRQPVINIGAFRREGRVLISITDNGLGINAAYLDKIFQLYKRFHYHVEGRGVGLFLVKTQVDSLGGHIEFESTVDVGTTVRIWLDQT